MVNFTENRHGMPHSAEPMGQKQPILYGDYADPAKTTYSRIAFFSRPCNSYTSWQNQSRGANARRSIVPSYGTVDLQITRAWLQQGKQGKASSSGVDTTHLNAHTR